MTKGKLVKFVLAVVALLSVATFSFCASAETLLTEIWFADFATTNEWGYDEMTKFQFTYWDAGLEKPMVVYGTYFGSSDGTGFVNVGYPHNAEMPAYQYGVFRRSDTFFTIEKNRVYRISTKLSIDLPYVLSEAPPLVFRLVTYDPTTGNVNLAEVPASILVQPIKREGFSFWEYKIDFVIDGSDNLVYRQVCGMSYEFRYTSAQGAQGINSYFGYYFDPARVYHSPAWGDAGQAAEWTVDELTKNANENADKIMQNQDKNTDRLIEAQREATDRLLSEDFGYVKPESPNVDKGLGDGDDLLNQLGEKVDEFTSGLDASLDELKQGMEQTGGFVSGAWEALPAPVVGVAAGGVVLLVIRKVVGR